MMDKLTKEYVDGMKEIDKILSLFGFRQSSLEKKGVAYFIAYKRGETLVQFLFGPPDWDTEMIIYISTEKFAFKDLLQIPAIAKWVDENRYTQENGRSIRNELLWDVELLKFSLPIIE